MTQADDCTAFAARLSARRSRVHTQRQLIDLACKRHALNASDLAALLGISRQALSQFKTGMPLPPERALTVAKLAGLRPEYVLVCVEYHRATRLGRANTLPVWERMAAAFAPASG